MKGDDETSLTEAGFRQAEGLGYRLSLFVPIPDVIIYSPYLRTKQTMEMIIKGWGEKISEVPTIPDDRIREQEHGLSNIYGDRRLFQTFHPEQKRLYELLGPYWYQYPQGESVAQVRDRIRLMMATLIREFSEKHVLMVTHHLTILSIRANLERLSPAQFIHLDKHEKPLNCGTTLYEGKPKRGKDGQLLLQAYNRCYFVS